MTVDQLKELVEGKIPALKGYKDYYSKNQDKI